MGFSFAVVAVVGDFARRALSRRKIASLVGQNFKPTSNLSCRKSITSRFALVQRQVVRSFIKAFAIGDSNDRFFLRGFAGIFKP